MGEQKIVAKRTKEGFKYPEDYYVWLSELFKSPNETILEQRYDAVAASMTRSFKESEFWVKFLDKCEEYNFAYKSKTGYKLFKKTPENIIKPKDYKSFLEKTYRINILHNRKFPDPPDEGWFSPQNWFSKINDIVRTNVVCNYIDGVMFLSEKMENLHKEICGNSCNVDYKAYEDGYYAVHIHLNEETYIPGEKWDKVKIASQFEIQITSQLHDFVRELLHKSYDSSRMTNDGKSIPWQWDSEHKYFETNFLGNFLHYFDFKIYEIRTKTGGQKNGRENC